MKNGFASDDEIKKLFFARNEDAINLSSEKYGRVCLSVAYNVLCDRRDSEEAFNDALLAAWNKIPPDDPDRLGAYLAKLTRNLALKLYRKKHAEKRGGGRVDSPIEELEECIPGPDVDDELEAKRLTDVLNSFLSSLAATERTVFVRRYWKLDGIREIAEALGFSEGKVKMMLKRTRDKLKKRLEKEEIRL